MKILKLDERIINEEHLNELAQQCMCPHCEGMLVYDPRNHIFGCKEWLHHKAYEYPNEFPAEKVQERNRHLRSRFNIDENGRIYKVLVCPDSPSGAQLVHNQTPDYWKNINDAIAAGTL